MKNLRFRTVAALFLSFVSVSVFAVNVPNTFTNGTVADAAEVNANFTALKNGINGVINSLNSTTFITTNRLIVDSSGVGSSTCSTGETIVSAGCSCTGAISEGSNFGLIFACFAIGNTAIGACSITSTFNSLLPSSPIEVRAMCSDITTSSPLPTAQAQSAPSAPSAPSQEAIDAANELRGRILMMREAFINK